MDNVAKSPGEDKKRTVGSAAVHSAPGAMPRAAFAVWVLLLAAGGSVWAGQAFAPRPVMVSVRDAGEIEKAAAIHAAGVILIAPAASGPATSELARAARERGLTFWLAARNLNAASALASALASADADGLALILSDPEQPASPRRNFDELMKIKREGDRLAEALQRLKARLGRRMLAVCAPLRAINPQTAASAYIPVKDMIRSGVVDWVCLSGAERYNFHRLRLQRDAALHAGLFVDAGAAPARTRAGLVARAVLAAGRSPSCEAVWLVGFPIDLARQAATDAAAAAKRREAERAAIEQAIRSGRFAVDQAIPASERNNQASVHGVAQSFTPSRDGECPLAEVYATIRGSAASDLKVEIRDDASGRPGKRVLAAAAIPAFALAHEPTYRWARAWFKPAAKLRKGQRYWLYLPNASARGGSYVWGIAGNGATERGRAWSSRYDYSKHS